MGSLRKIVGVFTAAVLLGATVYGCAGKSEQNYSTQPRQGWNITQDYCQRFHGSNDQNECSKKNK